MKIVYVSKRMLIIACFVLVVMMFAVFLLKSREDRIKSVFASPLSDKVVVIDAGHGGIDPGAVSSSGTKEDELNLKVAGKLEKYLKEHGTKVIMTRESSNGLSTTKSEDMRIRMSIIKESNADIVVSIHMNKFPQSKYYGAQTFYMTGSEEGKRLAQCIQQQLLDNLIEGNNRQIKAADNYRILKAGPSPAVIVECGFLSNPHEESLLKTDDYQEKIAWSIYSGIMTYFAGQ